MRPQIIRLLLGVALLARAEGTEAQSGLLVPTSTGRPDATVLSLREMTIDVSIARGYARVNVRQIFENHTSEIQEGTYRFALAPTAAIGDFAVWDGLIRIPGVILEKRRARAIYEALTTQRIDPGLLQQGEEDDRGAGDGAARPAPSGAAPFSVKVAPIPAKATKRLELVKRGFALRIAWPRALRAPHQSLWGRIRVVARPGRTSWLPRLRTTVEPHSRTPGAMERISPHGSCWGRRTSTGRQRMAAGSPRLVGSR